MKRVGKPVIFILVFVIAAMSYLSFAGIKNTVIKGAQDIRFGIDIKGGVDVTFTPPAGTTVTKTQMEAAVDRLNQRLDANNISDRELYPDYTSNRIILRFPWQAGVKDKDPESAIKELGSMAQLTVVGPDKVTILTGEDVESASAKPVANGFDVELKFKSTGISKFSAATAKFVGKNIDIYMDETLIESATVNSQITGDTCVIENTGATAMTSDYATDLATKINAGSLPFKLVTENYSTISPTLGQNALNVTVMAGILAFILICLFMILYYRLPGLIACVALCGHLAGTLLLISIPHFTLTLPGIAGIILSIGMAVDTNIITAERIKEELRVGKTLDGAIDAGFQRSFSAIFDGNITVVIVGALLMIFGSGTVFSFGYTLFIGVIFNFIMGITCSRLMLKSISKYSGVRKQFLFGGASK